MKPTCFYMSNNTFTLLCDLGNHSDGTDWLLKVMIDKGEVMDGTYRNDECIALLSLHLINLLGGGGGGGFGEMTAPLGLQIEEVSGETYFRILK